MIPFALKSFLFRLCHPAAWQAQRPVNPEFDEKIRNLMLSRMPVRVLDNYTVKLGDTVLWTRNFPYCYGYEYAYPERQQLEMLPRVLTRYMLRDYIYKYGVIAKGEQQ